MKVAFHYPGRCTGAPFDPVNLYTSARGLTGSEEAFFRYARELVHRGHDVFIYCKNPHGPYHRPGLSYFDDGDIAGHVAAWAPDSVVSWMSPDACGVAPSGTFRLYVEQCSDHGNTPYEWQHNVDAFGTLSHSHARHMFEQNGFPAERCRIVPNGVEVSDYEGARPKVRGRCVWASSHDRGLHHLLEAWPEVKRRAPHATLRVLYNPEGMNRFAEMPEQQVAWLENLRRRSCYQLDALERLRGRGVELVGSVSREQMTVELAAAEVLAYPCDPVRYTETFGSTVLEAMAAGALPVLGLADAFRELWGGVCPGVPAPVDPRGYAELLAGVLNNPEAAELDRAACRRAAEQYSWGKLGAKMEECLLSRGERGFERPRFRAPS